jgi:dCMP deaminase
MPFRAFETSPERALRWHHRYLEMAKLVSSWSRDPSTKVGAVIVRPDKTVLALGYNGFPRGCDDSAPLYEDRERKYERVVHAELNAILSSAERPIGATLYVWPFFTCARCAAAIIQSGIGRIVHPAMPVDGAEERWKKSWDEARSLYRECGIVVVEVDMDG